jgi:hypothetical protein
MEKASAVIHGAARDPKRMKISPGDDVRVRRPALQPVYHPSEQKSLAGGPGLETGATIAAAFSGQILRIRSSRGRAKLRSEDRSFSMQSFSTGVSPDTRR